MRLRTAGLLHYAQINDTAWITLCSVRRNQHPSPFLLQDGFHLVPLLVLLCSWSSEKGGVVCFLLFVFFRGTADHALRLGPYSLSSLCVLVLVFCLVVFFWVCCCFGCLVPVCCVCFRNRDGCWTLQIPYEFTLVAPYQETLDGKKI
jgi:hypothetical protein